MERLDHGQQGNLRADLLGEGKAVLHGRRRKRRPIRRHEHVFIHGNVLPGGGSYTSIAPGAWALIHRHEPAFDALTGGLDLHHEAFTGLRSDPATG
ncbi:hypothetical protein D3C72_2258140 [compost metagenome]